MKVKLLWIFVVLSVVSLFIVGVYAAWTGWPYTKEYAGSVFANGILEYRETQSKDSVFYLKLRPMNPSKQSHSYGTIKAI